MSKLQTILAQAGCEVDKETGAITPPVHFATTFERDPDGEYSKGFLYARYENPTRRRLEETLAELEGGKKARAYGSGMAAAAALLHSLEKGDHVILGDDIYHGVRILVTDYLTQLGIEYDEVDLQDFEALSDKLKLGTKLVWAETPSNPLLRICDIERLADFSHQVGAKLVVDATWTTPLLQRPLELGADIVFHALTKYLAGHSDVLAGALVFKDDDEHWDRVNRYSNYSGGVASPMDCWLTLRGMRSLAARMRIHCENANLIANYLDKHAEIEAVYYPGLETHPNHEVALNQMDDFGGMISFLVKKGKEAAFDLPAKMKVFKRATSLGGTESLIEHRASNESQPTKTPWNLIRISVGIEHPDDLIADFEQALAQI